MADKSRFQLSSLILCFSVHPSPPLRNTESSNSHSTIGYAHTNTGAHTCTHRHTHAYTGTRMHTQVHTGTHKHTQAHTRAHTGTHTQAHTQVHTQCCSMPPYFCSVSSASCLFTFAHSPLFTQSEPSAQTSLPSGSLLWTQGWLSVPTMYNYRIPWILYSN